MSLESAGAQEVLLEQELDFLRGYLDIQQTRFEDRLKVTMDIEPGALQALVPNMILQPLVENAIKHGIAPKASGGRITISAGRQAGLLKIQIKDDGPGFAGEPAGAIKFGVGLSNTRARLEQLYGGQHRFELRNGTEGGLLVELDLPFRTSNEGEKNGSRSGHNQDDHSGRRATGER